jgi:group II intron reverse transcriptase/maturase
MVVRLLIEPLYESIFAGFSYGFRPGKCCHDALDALYMCITRGSVNWILDADIKGYFDSIPHDKLIECIKYRLSDPRIITLIARWLKCGIMEGLKLHESTTGTPQGGIISPLLANIYLHYVLDTFTNEWRNKDSRGLVYIVRYADDFLVMFQYKGDARTYLSKLKWQFGKFGLELHPEKTRLIEFGAFATKNRKNRGQGKPETFDFLGFTHICSKTLNGKFKLLRQTIGKRLGRKLQEYKQKLKMMMHENFFDIVNALNQSLQGYFNYFAIHDNLNSLYTLRHQIIKEFYKVLRRRSEKAKSTVNWVWMNTVVTPFILKPHVKHPYPSERFRPNIKVFG